VEGEDWRGGGAGGQWRWPPRPLSRRGGGSVGGNGHAGELGEVQRKVGEPRLGVQPAGAWGWPRLPLLASAAGRRPAHEPQAGRRPL
jgi:hypothetical protein